MPSLTTNEVLNRVLIVHNRSLPRYLVDAVPWMRHGQVRGMETLRQIVRDQQQVVDRIGALITDADGFFELGEFPMVFTAYHDVAFDWLLPILIDRQQKTIDYLRKCATLLALAPLAKAVVEETVGLAVGHLHNLEDLQRASSVNGAPHETPIVAAH